MMFKLVFEDNGATQSLHGKDPGCVTRGHGSRFWLQDTCGLGGSLALSWHPEGLPLSAHR